MPDSIDAGHCPAESVCRQRVQSGDPSLCADNLEGQRTRGNFTARGVPYGLGPQQWDQLTKTTISDMEGQGCPFVREAVSVARKAPVPMPAGAKLRPYEEAEAAGDK